MRTPADALAGLQRRSDNCGCASGGTYCCIDCEDTGLGWECSNECGILKQ